MASKDNIMLTRYNPKFWGARAEAWDCSTQGWHGGNNWVHPELSRVLDVLLHAQACGARPTLVVPAWKGGKWWPLLVGEGGRFRNGVVDWGWLPKGCGHFTLGPHPALFGHGPLQLDVIALKLHYG